GHAVRALLNVAARLGLATTDGAGLLELPDGANGRGVREAGVLPNAGPGYSDPPAAGRAAEQIAAALAEGELSPLYLLHAHPLGVLTGAQATAQLAQAVPFYAGVTLDVIGGRGVNWQAREAASALPEAEAGPFELERPPAAASANGALRLATYRSIWASKEVEASPALRFLAPEQRVQLSPQDAERLGLGDGDPVEVSHDGV